MSHGLRYKTIFLLLILVLSCSLFSGCSSGRASDDEDGVKFLIGVSQANLSEPWRVEMNREIEEEAAKHSDLRLIFTDAAQDSVKQVKDVERLLEQGIDLLIISPNESAALTPVVTKAYRSIPVIVLDRAVEGYDYTLFIGPDNRLIGRKAGQLVADMLGEEGGNVIEIQGLSGSPPVRDRSEGFREVIEQNGNIKILDTIIADWQRDKAEDRMAELLKKYSDIDVVFAQNDPMALGAYLAAGKSGIKNLKFVGVDGLTGPKGGLQLVREGILKGTFTCHTGGKESIQYAIDILNKERGIPKKIILRSEQITQNNIEEYNGDRATTKNRIRPKERIILGFAQVGEESKWRKANSNSIKSAAMDENIELKFIDAQQSQEKQIKAIREFIRQKVDVIALSPIVETGWEGILKEAKAAGIPVVLSDRTIKVEDESLFAAFIGSDFVEEGRRAARWVIENMKERQGTVNIVELEGTIGAGPAIDRKNGFGEVLKDYSNFRISASESGDFTKEGGKLVMQKFLKQQGKEINVVYAHNDDMAFGAIEAIQEYGLRPGKDIKIVSIDAVKEAFQEMKEGRLNCTVECSPLLGPQLMKVVKDLAAGKTIPIRIITSEGVFPEEVAKKEYPNRLY